MVFTFALAALLWWGGKALGFSGSVRKAALLALFLAVAASNLALPAGNPLREMTGGDPRPWFLLALLSALAMAYARALRWMRGKARSGATGLEATPSGDPSKLADEELSRYARHIVLREIGGPGQRKLRAAHVLVIGAGGLGSPALLYLAAAGVGRITVIDDDTVDISNLQRQVIHETGAAGSPKVESAAKAMRALNPHVQVVTVNARLTGESGKDLAADADLILDGTDNFKTRYTANAIAVAAGIPLVSGALSQWEGQLSVFDPASDAPCYRCIFPEPPAPGLAPSCAEAGVLGPLPGVVGAMMAAEAVKLITGAGAPLRGAMLIYDALWGETRRIALKRRADCPTCGSIR